MKTPFLGAAYTTRTNLLGVNQLINMYPVKAEDQAKEIGAFVQCPGLVQYMDTGLAGCRGLYRASNGIAYGVNGSTLYTFAAGAMAVIGTISTASGPVSMADNGVQLALVDGVAGYYVPLAGGALTQITADGFPNGSRQIDFADTYLIAFNPANGVFGISGNNDAAAWDALDFGSAEGSPDKNKALIVNYRELWLFGDQSGEIFTDSGAADFPWERFQGGFIEKGIAAPYTLKKLDNSVFMLGSDINGAGVVYRSEGFNMVRISTHAIEFALSTYSTIEDAIAWTYQQDGHSFYVLSFPAAGKTWAYDVSAGGWHERAGFEDGEFTRYPATWHIYTEGKHIVGDYASGKLYELSQSAYDYDGKPLKWLRSWRGTENEEKYVNYARLEVSAEVGHGLNGLVQGADPQCVIRYSQNGGRNWSNEITRALGQIGQFNARVSVARLPRARNMVFEISGTDPVKTALCGAFVDAE